MPKGVGHRSYYADLNEMVAPQHTALLVIDMQNDYYHENGYYGRKGFDLSMIRDTVPPLQRLLKAGREAGVMVIFTKHAILPGFVSDSPVWLGIHAASGLRSLDQEDFYTIQGTWGQQIIDELKPAPRDIVIEKFRGSAFVGTELDLLLRSHRIETVVVTGQVTQGCVENTVRMARDLDYYAVLVRDCVASTRRENHEATMTNLRGRVPMPCADDLIKIWRGG